MLNSLQPWHIVLTALAGWINHHQQTVIDYLKEECGHNEEFTTSPVVVKGRFKIPFSS